MGNDDRSQSRKEADITGAFHAAAVEGLTGLLSKLHHMDATSKLGGPDLGRHLEGLMGRSSNLAFDSWTLGLHTWRQLLELGRKYDTDMLPGYIARAAVWADPTAELATPTTVLELVQYKKDNEAVFGGVLRIANRSKYTHQLELPRTVELRDANGKLSMTELEYEPDVPTLSPGDEVEIWVATLKDWHLGEPPTLNKARIGELVIRTRGPLAVTVPVVVKVVDDARPDDKKRSRDRRELRRKRATSRAAADRRNATARKGP